MLARLMVNGSIYQEMEVPDDTERVNVPVFPEIDFKRDAITIDGWDDYGPILARPEFGSRWFKLVEKDAERGIGVFVEE